MSLGDYSMSGSTNSSGFSDPYPKKNFTISSSKNFRACGALLDTAGEKYSIDLLNIAMAVLTYRI